MSEILARRSLRKEHLKKPHDKKSTPAKQHGIWRENVEAQGWGKSYVFYSPVKTKAPVLMSKNTEKRMFVVDSGASMHMLSKKDVRSDEMDTLRRSRNPATVVAANGEVQKKKKRHKCMFTITICSSQCGYSKRRQAVLSLGKLCSEQGCSYEWKNGETPRLTTNGKIITCIMDNFVPLVVPGLSSSSSSSSASTS